MTNFGIRWQPSYWDCTPQRAWGFTVEVGKAEALLPWREQALERLGARGENPRFLVKLEQQGRDE